MHDRKKIKCMNDIPFKSIQYTYTPNEDTITDDPLVIYDIRDPFLIILETCHENDGVCDIYEFSESIEKVTSLGNYLPEVNHRPLHRHSFIEIMYVLSGSVTNRIENQLFTYEAGQCCIMNKNIRHSEIFSGDFQVVFFMMRNDYILNLLEEYQKFSNNIDSTDHVDYVFHFFSDVQSPSSMFEKEYLDCFPIVASDIILEQIRPLFHTLILELLNRKIGSTFFIQGIFSRLLSLFSDPEFFYVNRVFSGSSGPEYLFNKITHILKCSHGQCSREELSMRLHYNKDYLNRVVKKQIGKTLTEYRRDIWLEEAATLIVHTSLSISAIAKKIGISNRNYFYRMFQKKYGVSPLQYREKEKNRCE